MKVCGFNSDYRLGGCLNNKDSNEDISFPCESTLKVPSMLSFSSFCNSVIIMQNGEAFAIGNNKKKQICSTLPKEQLKNETKINILNKNGQQCKFISSVGGYNYTLYQVSGETSNQPSQLVYAYENKETIFLNIDKRSPLALFGGFDTAAVIDIEGAVIIIENSIFKSPSSSLIALNLPNDDKAIKVACGRNRTVIALGLSSKVYECILKTSNYSFKEVNELIGIKITDISGTRDHFFAISEDRRVFGRGNNCNGQIGLPINFQEVKKFTVIDSLRKYHIVEAFAGNVDSLFRTFDGKILGCGWNNHGQLMLKNDKKKTNVNPPEETLITKGATFCISGAATSIVFVGIKPPINTPNKKILKFPELCKMTKTDTKIAIPKNAEIIKPAKSHEMISSPDEKTLLLKEKNLRLAKNITSFEDKYLSMQEELKREKMHNDDLEKEVKMLRAKIALIEKEKTTENRKEFDIFDTEALDKMKIIKSLGRGSTCEVFEVSREQRLALKVYHKELFIERKDVNDKKEDNFVLNTENIRRFLIEYECLNKLDNPNIIKTFGICFGDETHAPSILLEYCPSNLKDMIKVLNKSERIRAIVDISKAMKEVHSIGIIHRDLKLENILIDENNKIKISDFGLSTLITIEPETNRTQIAGTLKYMAPEIVQEKSDYNEKIDVYAFGVVVFLILTKGEYPQISLHEVGNGIRADIPDSISTFSRDLINKCWSYEASERPSFSEICQLLKGNENKLI